MENPSYPDWYRDLLRVLGRDPDRHDPGDELRNKLQAWKERWWLEIKFKHNPVIRKVYVDKQTGKTVPIENIPESVSAQPPARRKKGRK